MAVVVAVAVCGNNGGSNGLWRERFVAVVVLEIKVFSFHSSNTLIIF